MDFRATTPERVFDKVKECEFFLSLMQVYEQKQELDSFRFCVSAFLCAFRSIAYRLIGVTEHRVGREAKQNVRAMLWACDDIAFLKGTTDLEVHGDGVKIWSRFKISVSDATPGRWERPKEIFPSRFGSRYHKQLPTGVKFAGWIFEGRPANIVELFSATLAEIKKHVEQTLSYTAKSSSASCQ